MRTTWKPLSNETKRGDSVELSRFSIENKMQMDNLKEILEKAKENFGLSKRSEFKILKVAQTISDLENYDKINKKAVLEAVSYRRR